MGLHHMSMSLKQTNICHSCDPPSKYTTNISLLDVVAYLSTWLCCWKHVPLIHCQAGSNSIQQGKGARYSNEHDGLLPCTQTHATFQSHEVPLVCPWFLFQAFWGMVICAGATIALDFFMNDAMSARLYIRVHICLLSFLSICVIATLWWRCSALKLFKTGCLSECSVCKWCLLLPAFYLHTWWILVLPLGLRLLFFQFFKGQESTGC